MIVNQNSLEELIKSSQKNTEILLEHYFQLVNGGISDEETTKVLCEVSDNLTHMQTTIINNLRLRK